MRRRAVVALALLTGVAAQAAPVPRMAHSGPEQGSHPIPPYQFRGDPPPGDRFAAGRDGHQLFRAHCGTCHLDGGFGTNVLAARFGRAHIALPPLLELRRDLAADYIRLVVRGGRMAMPPLSRVEVTDAELNAISAYLAGRKK